MKIPKRINVGRKQYKVATVHKMERYKTVGRVSYADKEITIATHSNSTQRKFNDVEVSDSFWHELTHAILKDMGNKLEANEAFVTAFSSRLNKAILSAEF